MNIAPFFYPVSQKTGFIPDILFRCKRFHKNIGCRDTKNFRTVPTPPSNRTYGTEDPERKSDPTAYGRCCSRRLKISTASTSNEANGDMIKAKEYIYEE